MVVADAIGLAQLVKELLRHGGGLARIGDLLQQHAELVAADARDEVVAAHRGAQARGDDLQQAIADVVAERVVHRLEVVEVDEEERRGLLVAPRVRHRLARPLGEHGAVGQPGERVVMREELEPPRIVLQLDRGVAQVFLGALQLRNVVREHVEAEHFAARVEVRHAGDLQRAPPRAFAHRQLELDARAAEHALDVRPHAAVGVVAQDLRDGAALHALRRDTEPVVVGAIGEAIALRAINVGDERRHVVGDEPQSLLALTQRRFRFLGALRRASRHDHRRGKEQCRAGDQDVQHQLAWPRAAAREPGADRRDDLGSGGENQDCRA